MLNSNKTLLLSNSSLIESKLNDYLLTISDAQYKVECFYQVVSGRGFKSNQLMITIYNVGQWGTNVNFNVDTLELINVKTIGKYNKETTKDISNNVCWLYMMKLQNFLSGIIKDLQPIESIEVLPEIVEVVIDPIKTTQYHLYSHTFNTYSEASNYAYAKSFTTSMIIPSNSDISNEQLQSLELQYSINKHKMSYNDAQSFLSHLNSIPVTLHSEDRIIAMNRIVERYDNKIKNDKSINDNQIFMATQIEIMLKDMYSKGVIKVETGIMVKYNYNNECIYKWFSGITTEKMYSEILEVYNIYFNNQSNQFELSNTDQLIPNHTYTPSHILTS